MLAPDNTAPRETSLLKRVVTAFLGAPPPPRARPFQEMGVSGTSVHGGYVQTRERSSSWIGPQRYVSISDMAVNASIVAAGVHYFLNLIAHPKWAVEPADESDKAKKVAEFVDECLSDLTQPWSRVVRRMGTYRFYGFGVQEWTAKKRLDGRVGWLCIEPRPQHTIERWTVREDGAVAGVWQRSPQTGQELGIPRTKVIYLVDDVLTDSPEGVGLFRHLAQPWERLKRYYDLEARAFERDLRGTPIGRVPYTNIRQAVADGLITQTDAAKMTEAMEKFVKLQVKESDTAITLDSIPYFSQAADGSKVAAVQQWGLELLQGGAAGMAEVAAAIVRTQQEMARILTCENLMMGEASGNRALSEDKSRNLYLVANACLSDMASAVTLDAVPALCDLNGVPEELRPRCRVEDVAFKDADAVAATLAKMAQAGAVLTPDDPVVADVRQLMGVSPPAPVSPELMGLPGGVPLPPDPTELEDEDEDEDDEEDDEAPGDGKKKPPFGKAARRTLYVKRRLLNADAVREHFARQGLESALPSEDMHVTVMFSRAPVDWRAGSPDRTRLRAEGDPRSVHQFPPRSTPNGALVLRFESPRLAARHEELRAMGASWDFPEFLPHITITYSVPEADAAAVEPYRGPLVLGPEEWAEVDEDWASGIREESLAKYDPNQPRDEIGRWTTVGGGGGADVKDDAAGVSSEGAAQALLAESLDPDATLESLMAEMTPQQLELMAAARAAQAAATPTRDLYRREDGTYTSEREALHEKILSDMFTPEAVAGATPAPGERPEFVMTGGRPAAGKTSSLESAGLNVGPPKYIYLSADAIQEHLPGYRGDMAGTFNPEAQDIADKAESIARKLGVNLVFDATMKTGESARKRVDAFRAAGYDVSAFFIHTAPQVSARRSLERFVRSGRFVPPEVSLNSRTNEKTFDDLTPQFKRWAIFDNNGSAPRLVRSSGLAKGYWSW